ncbi:hypothetical protein JMA_04160 [Jeotgalibacillus malaysiensis]|uniref:DUF4279 domain-containing protein n=1 Tax=Jeotgalibacillus malaysiensis TaxID=1508404 RepID=A0A0B5AMF1_9BACL|nr:DUF4279 domain-containing protein [Jeotgalibacillus malaysiensis]AJD89733.1 hypothetical protein JMA_04160 [Jeotgalibacillus malaysiensis]
MNKTKTMIYFEIAATQMDPDVITEKLNIQPSESYRNGDLIEDSFYRYRQRSVWRISSGYQEDLFLDESFKKVIDPLRMKTAVINDIRKEFSATCHLIVVSEMFNGQAPALGFFADIIRFAADIHADIELDLYPWEY